MRVRRILGIAVFVIQAAVFSPAFASAGDSGEKDHACPPSAELLEFIGEWETGGGEWLDPTLLEDWCPGEEVRKEGDDETH